MNIYPNPVIDNCNLVLDMEYSQIKIDIFDSKGCKVKDYNSNNANLIQLNLNNLPKGVYLMHVQVDENSLIRKFLKM